MASVAESWGESVLVERARRLAPWLVMFAMSYPLLLWPLLEAPPAPALGDLAPPTPDTQGVLNRIFFPPLFLAGMAVFALQLRTTAMNVFRPAILLTLLYLAWAFATAIWGIEPDVTLRRSMLQLTIIGSTLLPALAARDPQAVLDKLFWLFALVAGINLVAVTIYPPGPIGHEGIYAHKNTLGGVAAMAFVFAVLQAVSGRGFARFAALCTMAASMVILLASLSKTSLGLAFLIPATAIAACLVMRWMRISPALSITAGVAALYVIYEIGVRTYVWDFDSVATFIFGDPTLTQRTDIWEFALKMIERRPWLGYGYEAFWGVSFESPSMREGPGFVAQMPHAHNGFIDLVIHTGFVGLAMVVALILVMLHGAGRIARVSIPVSFSLLALTLSCVFYNITETTLFRSFDLQHLIFLVTVGLICSAQDIVEGRFHA